MSILFLEDFAKTNCSIQWNTSNPSAKRMAGVLRSMGVNNYYFHLALTQPDLDGVDPYDENLDSLTMAKILYECNINYWYFIREVLRVTQHGSGKTIPYEFNRANLASDFIFFADCDQFRVQPRQTGKTYGTQGKIAYMMYIKGDHLTVGMWTKDTNLLQENVQRLKDIRDSLPWYFVSKSSKDWDRKEGVSYAARGNYYRTFTAATSERDAPKLGRGGSYAIEHFDEIAFIKYNHLTVPSAIAAMGEASTAARASGIPAPIVYTTTAGDPATPEGMYALNIATRGLEFSEKFYDCKDQAELKELLCSRSSNRVFYIEYSYQQLGRNESWYQEQVARANAAEDQIARDYLNAWISSGDRTIISPELLKKIQANVRDPSFEEIEDAFIVKYYVDRHIAESTAFKEKPLVMGVDTSENIGRDFTTITILDPVDMSIVATGRGNCANIMSVGRYLVNALLKYPKLVIIPEAKSTAVTLINFIIEELQNNNINPYYRIYNKVVQNYDDKQFKDVNIRNYREIYGADKAYFGYKTAGTGGNARSILYKETMFKALERNFDKIYDKTIYRELTTLEERNGRVDHPKGAHDDTVISYLLACYFIFYGKHLDIYGFDPAHVLVNYTEGSPDKAERDLQIFYQRRYAELTRLVENTSSDMLRGAYKREMISLRRLMNNDSLITEPVAITQVERERAEIKGNTFDMAKANRIINRLQL